MFALVTIFHFFDSNFMKIMCISSLIHYKKSYLIVITVWSIDEEIVGYAFSLNDIWFHKFLFDPTYDLPKESLKNLTQLFLFLFFFFSFFFVDFSTYSSLLVPFFLLLPPCLSLCTALKQFNDDILIDGNSICDPKYNWEFDLFAK